MRKTMGLSLLFQVSICVDGQADQFRECVTFSMSVVSRTGLLLTYAVVSRSIRSWALLQRETWVKKPQSR